MQQKPNKNIFNRLVWCQEFKIISIRLEIRNQHVEMHQIPSMEEKSATSSAKPISLLSMQLHYAMIFQHIYSMPMFQLARLGLHSLALRLRFFKLGLHVQPQMYINRRPCFIGLFGSTFPQAVCKIASHFVNRQGLCKMAGECSVICRHFNCLGIVQIAGFLKLPVSHTLRTAGHVRVPGSLVHRNYEPLTGIIFIIMSMVSANDNHFRTICDTMLWSSCPQTWCSSYSCTSATSTASTRAGWTSSASPRRCWSESRTRPPPPPPHSRKSRPQRRRLTERRRGCSHV